MGCEAWRGNFREGTWQALGESALLFAWAEDPGLVLTRRLAVVAEELRLDPPHGFLDCALGMNTLGIFVDPEQVTLSEMARRVAERLDAAATRPLLHPPRTWEVAVCYGGEYGPDLEFVASHHRLSPAAVIAAHQQSSYYVRMIGFSPGFPYLGGLPPGLATPRLPTPRVVVPAGSVAIGGNLTGIYPQATPGGWRIIGRASGQWFAPENSPPCPWRAGDQVCFRAVTAEEFLGASVGGTPWAAGNSNFS